MMPSMDITKESLTEIVSTPSNTKDDVSSKTTALDRERFEVACLRQDIIDEYEQKSRELLDYLVKLETEFKQQQRQYEQREAILRHENKNLKDELSRGSKVAKRMLLSKPRKYQCKRPEIGSTLDVLNDETRQHEWNYQMEHIRAEELKAFVDGLQLELQRAEEIALQRKKRMEQSKQRMELENQDLRRKAALGWMLGCLSELYVRIDPKVGGAGIMKLVRKVQRELESGSNGFNGGGAPPVLQYDALQEEVHRLIRSSRFVPLRHTTTEPCSALKENVARGATHSCNTGEEQDESPRRRRKQWQKYDLDTMTVEDLKRPATSLASIFEDFHKDKSQKASECNPWVETRAMDAVPVASHECVKAETIGMLKGLEKSMNFLLSKEKKRVWC